MLHNLVPTASEMKIKLRSMLAAADSTENDQVEDEALQDVSRNPTTPELHAMQIPTSQFYSSASSDLNFSPTALAARDAQRNESRGKKSFGAVVAANVDRLRLAKGLALAQLAVSSTSINSWKQGTMRPSDNSLEKLARQFGVPIDELKTGHSSDEEVVDLPTITQSFKKQKVNIEEKVKTVQLKEAKDVVLKLQIQLAAAEAENHRIRKMYDELFKESMVELERAYQSQIHILTKTIEANQPALKRAREELDNG
jgi:transcriptional regulator with XRE-family HTH domain